MASILLHNVFTANVLYSIGKNIQISLTHLCTEFRNIFKSDNLLRIQSDMPNIFK